MRKLILLILGSVLTANMFAQQGNASKMQVLNPSELEVFYDYLALDTVLGQSLNTTMALQIGSQVERFIDDFVYHRDSLDWATNHQEKNKEKGWQTISLGQKFFTEYWHHKESDVFETNYIPGISHVYSYDSIAQQEWNIDYADTLTICGYACCKATCKFRGREWTVWYAPEIPYSSGPWKLHGLPGLILQAEEADHVIFLKAIEIRRGGDYPVEIYSKEFRNKFKKVEEGWLLNIQRIERTEPEEYLKLYPMMRTYTWPDRQPIKPKRTFYCPFEK